MQLELIKAEGGKMIAVLPQEIADLPAKLEALQKSLTESSARLAETAQPKDDEIAHLTEEVARLESPEHAHKVFIDYARKLNPEGFVKLAEILGFEPMIPQASVAEVEEAGIIDSTRGRQKKLIFALADAEKALEIERRPRSHEDVLPDELSLPISKAINKALQWLEENLAEVAESAVAYEEKPSLVTKDPHDTAYIAYPSLGIWVLGKANDSKQAAR